MIMSSAAPGGRVSAAAAPSGSAGAAPPDTRHAAFSHVDDVLAELLQFPDEVLWPALCELPPKTAGACTT